MTPPISFIDRIERGLDDTTKAVLDLAFVRDELTPEAFARVLSTFTQGQAELVEQIADDLAAALDLRTDEPREVLARYGYPRALDPLTVCEAVAQDKEADAIRAAQLVASLIVRGAAA